MSVNFRSPWHKASYDHFLSNTMPQLLSERLPLAGYQVIDNGPVNPTCSVRVELSGGVQATYFAIPRPDGEGVFYLQDTPFVVVPLAANEALDQAEVACVGEQLYNFVQARLGQASDGMIWDEAILRAWLPLDDWVNEFLQSTAQPLDTTNWLSRYTHLRRLLIRERSSVVDPGQMGRVCPFETPEGPNIGRVFTIAVGAEVRAQRLVVVDENPVANLGLSASMLPFLEHNDPNRLLMAANMLRQGIPPVHPEPAWVQTGLEPDAPDFWCGHNLLTAFISWGPGTSEDGILLSESASRRMLDPFPVEPGDKLSNRHGSKGVVSYILPDEQMPHLLDGTPVELVYNFPGLRTRMHLGQVREAVMGRVAHREGAPVVVPPFQAPPPEQIRQRLASAGLPETGMEMLRQGKNGPALELPSTVGWVYWTRLYHLAKDKLKFTLEGAGNMDDAGQVLGGMEFNVLKELGAAATMHEALTSRSTRSTQGGVLSPMFLDLQRRLEVAGIQAELGGGRLAFHLAPPAGPVLKLALPQPHPWLSEHLLETVGVVAAEENTSLPVVEFTRLAEANVKLTRLLDSHVPERLVREAEARLQEALGAFINALLPPEVLRFHERQSFSGRAVIAPGDGLGLDQAGLPEAWCWKLFGKQVTAALPGQAAVGPENPLAVQALDAILAGSWVLINHAPTFSPTALLAFHPVRDPGNVIRLNPAVCRWMNSDFDGDQAAFHLPQTEASQQEAGELLTVAGQLNCQPALVKTLLPPAEVIWGLAWRSLTPQGRDEIARLAGVEENGLETVLTQAGLTDLLSRVLKRDGVTEMLDVFQRLVEIGYEAARASGASMSPFIQSSETLPPPPQSESPERWERYFEELAEKILASSNYRDIHIGPQLLDARARAWNRRSLVILAGARGIVTDAYGKPAMIRHSYAQGLSAQEMYTCVVGARQGFAQIHVQNEQMVQEAQKRNEPVSLSVVSRALRARYPGVVFARAAANGEVDPLLDLDSRLLVGWGSGDI